MCPEKPAKVYEPAKLTIEVNDATIARSGERTTPASDDQTTPASDKQTRQALEGLLPTEVSVLYYDGTLRKHAVIWDKEPSGSQEVVQAWREGKIGSYEFSGSVCASLTVTQQIDLVESLDKGENLIQDSNWDNGFTAWQIEKSDEKVQALFYPEMVEPFPAPPINALRVEAPMNFRFTISQKLTLQSAGDYRLSVYYRGVDTTNVDVRLFMQVSEECKEQVIHPTDDEWTEHSIEWKDCPAGEATVGIRISSPPVYGMIRGFTLVKNIC